MTRVQPLKNLRKTTILVIAVFLGFLIHRIVVFCMDDVPFLDPAESELITASGVVCSHIVNGSPFGVDSTFDMDSRVYFYTSVHRTVLADEDTLLHVWFNGADTIMKLPCHLSGEICFTSLDPKLMVVGEWSVDFIAGRKLLATRQFKVTPSLR